MSKDDADLIAWFRELTASDPIQRLQKFREHHPSQPIPPDLEFTARYEAILSNASIPSGEAFIISIVEKHLREETRPGAPYKAWHAPAFKRIDTLVRDEGMTRNAAITTIHSELEAKGIHVARASLRRAYQRFQHDFLVEQIAQAIVDHDIGVGTAALRELARRKEQDGRKKGPEKLLSSPTND